MNTLYPLAGNNTAHLMRSGARETLPLATKFDNLTDKIDIMLNHLKKISADTLDISKIGKSEKFKAVIGTLIEDVGLIKDYISKVDQTEAKLKEFKSLYARYRSRYISIIEILNKIPPYDTPIKRKI